MPSEILNRANSLIKEIQEQRKAKASRMDEYWKVTTAGSPIRERKPPREFKDSSYLYIRSYDSDNGTRPGLSNVPYWVSPDINIAPLSSMNSYTTELNVGTTYNIDCLVHNRGDLNVPAANVEFYLVTPSLGFDTRFAKKLGVVNTWVGCYQSSKVNIRYLVPPDDAGHRCLFARVFSFSPKDYPVHDTLLDPYNDRHIGQKNLNIAVQETMMQIQLLHMPQADITVRLVPMKRDAVLALRHPSAGDFNIADGDRVEKMIREFNFDFVEKESAAALTMERGSAHFKFNRKGRFTLDDQARILKETEKIRRAVLPGRGTYTRFREELDMHRQMKQEHMMTALNFKIPNLGLQKGEMAGIEIVATNNVNKEIFGGITLLVTG